MIPSPGKGGYRRERAHGSGVEIRAAFGCCVLVMRTHARLCSPRARDAGVSNEFWRFSRNDSTVTLHSPAGQGRLRLRGGLRKRRGEISRRGRKEAHLH